jgi:hypothetical protein
MEIKMTKVNYQDARSETQRLKDKLKPSSGGLLDEWPANSSTTTSPTRTVTSIFHSAMQQNSTVSGQPRGSHPEAVGVGGFFTDNDESWGKQYGSSEKKGLKLDAFLLKRR